MADIGAWRICSNGFVPIVLVFYTVTTPRLSIYFFVSCLSSDNEPRVRLPGGFGCTSRERSPPGFYYWSGVFGLPPGAPAGKQGGGTCPPWKLTCQVYFMFKFAK